MPQELADTTDQSRPDEDLRQLAIAHQILEAEGHGDLTLGHMAMRDPSGRGLWLKRFGIGLGEVHEPEDFILIDFDGNQLAGTGKRHKEWPIHSEIMRAREDVMVTAHTHPLYASVFSAARTQLQPVTQEATYFPNGVPTFNETSGLVDSSKLGALLARKIGTEPAVFITNHGVCFCGGSIEMATLYGVFLERACRAQILISCSGLPWSVAPDFSPESGRAAELLPPENVKNHWDYLCRRHAPNSQPRPAN